MFHSSRLIIVLLLFLNEEVDVTVSVRKFIYQKDMSEYCRRHVVPSVFLGRQVVDAYSQILHFSRLDLPYSCFVSIRTESGSNIILVIQLMSDKSLVESCRESKNQLLVYDLGETFGGYWGPLPNNVMKSAPHPHKEEHRYTLKTTQPATTTTTERSTTTESTWHTTTKSSDDESKKSTSEESGIVVEVPIVNVSANLYPGSMSDDKGLNHDDSFDRKYDVIPWPGVSYKTKILPLMQFSIADEVSALRTDKDAGESHYKLDINADFFTPDFRLQFPVLQLSTKGIQRGKFKFNVDRRLDFKKNKKLLAEKEPLFHRMSPYGKTSFESHSGDLFTTPYHLIPPSSHRDSEPVSKSWEAVDAILKNLSKKNDTPNTNIKIDKDVANLLQGLAKIGPNESSHMFLVPNALWRTRYLGTTIRRITTKRRTDLITWRQPSASYRTNYLEEEEDTLNAESLLHEPNKSFNEMQAMNNNDSVVNNDRRSGVLLPPVLDDNRVMLNVSQDNNKEDYNIMTSLATEVNGTSTTATMSKKTNYLDEEEDTSKAEGLLHELEPNNISFNEMHAMNNNDSVINNDRRSGVLLPPVLDDNRVILNVSQNSNKEDYSNMMISLATEVNGTSTTAAAATMSKNVKPLTLVDHESWENMVHAASLMAVVLNQSVTSSVHDERQGLNVTLLSSSVARKKRYVHAIPIGHAKPHHLPTKMVLPTSTGHTDKISNEQEFQRLIELQEDEIVDRVSLRYLRNYVGPALFNICDYNESTARYVYLFNSSRLVLALTNFTLERLTVVMTPARTLLTSDARCEEANLECQVSGARVCIDSLSACDGVPNCGSYDIYDEDRLMCGGPAGVQYNVCLAAITFLAVLLTVLYTVHYWLKRCVPKVSDAFFIYTDAAENVLYLETIMRSPHDTEDPRNFYQGGVIPDYLEYQDMGIKKKTFGSCIFSFFRLFRCKRKKRMENVPGDPISSVEDDNIQPDGKRLFSYGELELGKMGFPIPGNDVAVQTGSSLEIEIVNKILISERVGGYDSKIEILETQFEEKRRSIYNDRLVLDSDILSRPSDELSILNFFKDHRARSVSVQLSFNNAKQPANTEEKEIQCLEYDQDMKDTTDSVISISDEIIDNKPKHDVVRKKLRFEEEAMMVQASDDDVQEDAIVSERNRRSVSYVKKKRTDDTYSNIDIDEPSSSTNREFKSYFWSSNKNKSKKPTKKKTQLSIR